LDTSRGDVSSGETSRDELRRVALPETLSALLGQVREGGRRMTADQRPPTSAEWRAISTRDRRADGRFVWVALTTNIYCRPSCAARRPPQRKTVILQSVVEAERHGYSACKRCHPESNALPSAESAIAVALEYIRAHIDQPLTLRTLSELAGLSLNHFRLVFTKVVGLSPRDYCDHQRVARLRDLLRNGKSVADAAYAAGFGSMRALYENAARHLGMTPATYKRGGAGLSVRYAVLDAALGRVLLVFTDRGICTVLVGDRDDDVVGQLSRDMPRATVRREQTPPAAWIAAVRACEREQPLLSTLPFLVRRDVFAARVARMLQQ
jgi:AraC family transcriptional regulator of adaptative response/methylated-DNA-[protein]-cysteine methyltransferase